MERTLWWLAAACATAATVVGAANGRFSWWFPLAAAAFAGRALLTRDR